MSMIWSQTMRSVAPTYFASWPFLNSPGVESLPQLRCGKAGKSATELRFMGNIAPQRPTAKAPQGNIVEQPVR
jgi:hypothetical protein